MRAVFLPGGRHVEIRDIARPTPQAGQVLIAVRAAGLCGSDLHMHYRPAPERRYGPIFGLATNPTIVPGHEAAGIVTELGPEVTDFRVGDRVAIHHMGGCGHCMACRRGWDINCQHKWGVYGLDRPGAMQEYMVARSRDCVHLPANIGFEEAAYYTCGAGTGYLALKRAGLGIGDSVAVVGLGPVGVAAAYFAKLAGAPVVGLDVVESRCAFAEQIGIDATYNAREADVAARVQESTGGFGADVVIESSGSAAGRATALEIAGIGGRVVCVGFADTDNVLDVQARIIQKQLDVRGAWMFPLPDLQDMLNDVSRRRVSIRKLITGMYGLEEAATAWGVFDRGCPGKVTLRWDDGSAVRTEQGPANRGETS